jgi:hypothetical protein
MTQDQYQKCRADLNALCDGIGKAKGQDYAKELDVLSSFKECAALSGMSKYQAWLVYVAKHFSAVTNAITRNPNAPEVKSEPLQGRLADLVNYAHLLNAMLVEDAEAAPKPKRPYHRKPKPLGKLEFINISMEEMEKIKVEEGVVA